MDNTNKVAVVTGSAKGIGRSIALRLAQSGYNIVINYRSESSREAAEKTMADCKSFNVDAQIFRADVSTENACSSLIDFTVKTFGGLHVLVNNAGTAQYGLLTRISEDEYLKTIANCQNSVFFMMKHAAKVMKKQKYGRIINISSMAGLRGASCMLAYSAAKGAVIAMTLSASKELAEKNITVNAIAPGMIDTNLDAVIDEAHKKNVTEHIRMKRYGTPSEVAGAAAFLASDEASYVTGAVIEIHGSMES